MHQPQKLRSAGQLLIDQLAIHGVTHAFCVPGESYLAAIDAFHDSKIELIVCRQEGGAAYMAEAHGKATGRPGICFVTRGPGATNASAGIHVAKQDGTPLIVFVGQIGREMRGREAFQELDYRAVFGTMSKMTTEIDDPARIPEIISSAFHAATSGTPGPVVIALPEDMLVEKVSVGDARPYTPVDSWPGPSEMATLRTMLAVAKAPFAILGGSRWSQAACDEFAAFARAWSLPTCTVFRRTHLMDALHPCYAGDLGPVTHRSLIERIVEADLVLWVGDRMSEMPTQKYSLFDIPTPQMKLIHVHPCAQELGKVYQADLAINASPITFSAGLKDITPPDDVAWRGSERDAHADYLTYTDKAPSQSEGVNLGEVMIWLRDNLPDDSIVTNGAGNYTSWLHRFYRFRRYATQYAPSSGSMGYGLPASVAMKTLYPDRTVVCVTGDGDFLMNGQEFMTAVQYKAPIIVVLADNGMYGTIRMHQEMFFPGRVIGTDLVNPDFAGYAKVFGGFGATVERTEDFADAFKAAKASGKPSILHLKVSKDRITPDATIAQVRAGEFRLVRRT